MDIFTHDLSLFDFNLSDPIIESLSQRFDPPASYPSSSSAAVAGPADEFDPTAATASPPRHRHDGLSPLPLGMDWSLPPSKWDGRSTVWPHDPRTGWSYCVTIPSWTLIPKSRGSEPLVFYRVQVGIQSPEGATTTRSVLRRFSDFLKLYKELKKEFPRKMLPPTPPKKLLRIKSRIQLDERRCSLEDWMEKVLSDIDLSRTATVANFLELEAAARSAFNDINEQSLDWTSSAAEVYPSIAYPPASDAPIDAPIAAASPSVMSDNGNDSSYEVSELGTPRHSHNTLVDFSIEASEHELANRTDKMKYGMFSRNFILDNIERYSRHRAHTGEDDVDVSGKRVYNPGGLRYLDEEIPSEADSFKPNSHVRRLSTESISSDLSSLRASEVSNFGMTNLFGNRSLDHPEDSAAVGAVDTVSSVPQMRGDFVIAILLEERQKLNRVLTTAKQRLSTAKTDMEDLIARLNQEVAVRQFLQTKVKDLEVDLEATRVNCNEKMQQATLIEKEKFTQMQWDLEELRRKFLEVELRLKAEQEEKALLEFEKMSVIQEREMLVHKLDDAREELSELQKHHEESEAKSKAEVKLLVKEVKSLRSSRSELKQEFSRLLKEKVELERKLQREEKRVERADAANAKLLHECVILRDRLQECSVNFLSEEEDKLILDTSSPSDVLDLLTTSDNRIGLLLAEAQLLSQDVENAVTASDETENVDGGKVRRSEDDLRKMVTDTFIDNATLRKQVNSVIRCALNTYATSEKDEEEEEEQAPLRKTVLSKFLER